MRVLRLLGVLVVLALVGPLPAAAAGVGVVLLPARNSFSTQFDGIVPRLAAAGYTAVALNTCWSARRSFDMTADQCQGDIDAAVADLKAKGMDRIVVAGNDFGGMFALYYAGNHPTIAGVVAWGPRSFVRSGNDDTLAAANRLVSAGQGDKPGAFNDGRHTTANQMLSFEGPNSVFADQEVLLRKVSVPVLWLAANDDHGTRDPTPRFAWIKGNPLGILMWSTSDQYSMVDVSLDQVIQWLSKVKAAP